jgi:hypothetical protein
MAEKFVSSSAVVGPGPVNFFWAVEQQQTRVLGWSTVLCDPIKSIYRQNKGEESAISLSANPLTLGKEMNFQFLSFSPLARLNQRG